MAKALCIAAMVISLVVFILFFSDLIIGKLLGMPSLAPFRGAYWPIDVVFAICAFVLGFLSWLTFREQT